MDIIEKMEKRQDELLDKLGQTQYGSNEYKAISEDLGKLSQMKVSEIQAEQTKYQNNERNDIEREKLEIEKEKLRVERKRINVNVFDTFFGAGQCLGYTWLAYHGEQISYAIKAISDVGKGFLRRKH